MQVQIEYGTQVRAASGLREQTFEVTDGQSLAQMLVSLRRAHSPQLDLWLSESGNPRPGLLVFVNDESPMDYQTHQLTDGDQVALMTLVSGG